MTMTTASYSAYSALSTRTAAPQRGNLIKRFIDRLIQARMARAEAVIRANSHLLPPELEDRAAWQITERSEGSLPFIR